MDVLDLTRELVSIESVTTREARVAGFVADRLEQSGWHVVRQQILGGDPEIKKERINVLAVDRPDRVPTVVLTTHIDTVPPFIPLTEDGEYIYGRGTCDAKGILAAQWCAAERLRAAGHEGIAILAVVGEETDSCGAKAVHQILPEARWIIDGEPTGMMMTSAAKGVLALELKTSGTPSHSAYPELGHSAVHDLILATQRLLEKPLPADPAFGETTVNVGRLEGGIAGNVFAPSAEATVVVRVAAPLEDVQNEIKKRLGPAVEVSVLTASDPLEIYVPHGYQSAPVSFGSDVPHLNGLGRPLLVGPGSIHDAHTRGEKIGKQELTDAVSFYESLGQRLLREHEAATDQS